MRKSNDGAFKNDSEISSILGKDALSAREIRRSDGLAYENSFLRVLLQKAKRSYKTSGNSSAISFD